MVAVTAGAAAVTSIGPVVSQVPSRNELMDYQLLQRELAMEREKNRRMHELVEADRATIDALSARMIAAEEALQKSEVKRAELLKEYCFISEKYRFLHSAVFSRSESSEGYNGSKQVHNTTAQTATSSASTWTPRHDGSRNVNDPTATPTADRSGRRQRNLSELAAAFPSPRSDRADEGATPPTEYLTAAQTPPPQAVRHSTPIAIPDLQTASIQHSRHHLYQQSPSHHHQQQQQQDQQDQHHQQASETLA
ncbi:hypothetical protein GQ42DRAFT_155685 [Ramicandelaber brevisporus]|nr:hypothetical protein GQ42DRAFT_155685 [Ramicandelaber brevisporus]